MADLRALRRKLEAEIKVLQDKLQALEMIESELSEKPRSRQRSRAGTVTEAVRQAVLGDRTKVWTAEEALTAVRGDGAPDANRDNVSTAIRRLVRDEVLERVGGNKRVGFTYRVKEGTK